MTRKEAIDILKKNYPDNCYELLREAVDMAIKALDRPAGHWEEVRDMWGDTLWRCDCCGIEWVFIEGNPMDNGTNYCPNCGAKMDGKENEE